MPISMDERNVAKISYGGEDVEVYYRNPTSAELAAFRATQVRRKKNRLINNIFAARMEGGRKVISGIRDGDFEFEGGLISSDPHSPHFRQDWKALLIKHLPIVVEQVGRAAFEGGLDDDDEVEFVTAGFPDDEMDKGLVTPDAPEMPEPADVPETPEPPKAPEPPHVPLAPVS